MNTREHPEPVRIRMFALSYGNLDEAEKAYIKEHIQTCNDCLDIYNIHIWQQDPTIDNLIRYKTRREVRDGVL